VQDSAAQQILARLESKMHFHLIAAGATGPNPVDPADHDLDRLDPLPQLVVVPVTNTNQI
jgi:hypothetical protein